MPADLLLERSAVPTGYRLTSVSQSYERVRRGDDPWIVFGNFIDDWRRAEPDQRPLLVAEPIRTTAHDPHRRWAALFAAAADWVCWTAEPKVERPAWLADDIYVLPEPWFLIEGTALRTWQLVQSPTPFRMRRIFTDSSVVARA
ncbi:MAG: hypothetical protein WEG56_11015 [Chloroflexota bacterium]